MKIEAKLIAFAKPLETALRKAGVSTVALLNSCNAAVCSGRLVVGENKLGSTRCFAKTATATTRGSTSWTYEHEKITLPLQFVEFNGAVAKLVKTYPTIESKEMPIPAIFDNWIAAHKPSAAAKAAKAATVPKVPEAVKA